MMRTSLLVLVGLITAGVLLDPYTLNHDASHFVRPGPWWQQVLGLTDLGLLAGTLRMVWRRRYDGALILLAVETVWAIGSVLILASRDGTGRFVRGFGGETYLTEYLLVMGLRFVTLVLLWFGARHMRRSAEVTH